MIFAESATVKGKLFGEYRERIAPLVRAGKELAEAYGRTVEKYRLLLELIREKHFDPQEVTHALTEAGLHPTRISEIKRVAFTSDEIFNAYMQRLIGFRAALEATRRRGAQATDELRWNRLLARFDRLSDQCLPTQDFYPGEKFCFFMFPRDGWGSPDDPSAVSKTFSVPGWEISVRRVMKPKRANKPKTKGKGRK